MSTSDLGDCHVRLPNCSQAIHISLTDWPILVLSVRRAARGAAATALFRDRLACSRSPRPRVRGSPARDISTSLSPFINLARF